MPGINSLFAGWWGDLGIPGVLSLDVVGEEDDSK